MKPKLAAFPKCYLDQIVAMRSMSVFDWIRQAESLDADGLEMYEGFFTSLDDSYLDTVGEAIASAGFVRLKIASQRATAPCPAYGQARFPVLLLLRIAGSETVPGK